MNKDFTRNKLIECPEPGILFTRDNAIWAYRALKAARENGQSVPEQDELCGELAGILFPDWATTDREKILARFAPPGPSPRPDNALSPRQVSDEIPGEDSTDDPDDPDPAFDPEAAALLPALGKLMNPARPEGALFYDSPRADQLRQAARLDPGLRARDPARPDLPPPRPLGRDRHPQLQDRLAGGRDPGPAAAPVGF
jgi:hypothetical protein